MNLTMRVVQSVCRPIKRRLGMSDTRSCGQCVDHKQAVADLPWPLVVAIV